MRQTRLEVGIWETTLWNSGLGSNTIYKYFKKGHSNLLLIIAIKVHCIFSHYPCEFSNAYYLEGKRFTAVAINIFVGLDAGMHPKQ